MRGELLWFNEKKNFGFIRTEDDERLYVHRTGFEGAAPVGRCAGVKVTFERTENGGPEGTAQAVSVSVDEDINARRARRRHQNTVRS